MREVRVEDAQLIIQNLEAWVGALRESVTLPANTEIAATPHPRPFPQPPTWGNECWGLRRIQLDDVTGALCTIQGALSAVREVIGGLGPNTIVGQTSQWDVNCPGPGAR